MLAGAVALICGICMILFNARVAVMARRASRQTFKVENNDPIGWRVLSVLMGLAAIGFAVINVFF